MLFILNGNGVPSVAKIIQLSSASAGPTLSSLSPSSASAGGPAFTLTVNGSNFVSGSSGAVERCSAHHYLCQCDTDLQRQFQPVTLRPRELLR